MESAGGEMEAATEKDGSRQKIEDFFSASPCPWRVLSLHFEYWFQIMWSELRTDG